MEELTRLGLQQKSLDRLRSQGIFTVEELAEKSEDDSLGLSHFRKSEWSRLVAMARFFLLPKLFSKEILAIKDNGTVELSKSDSLTALCVVTGLMKVDEKAVEVRITPDGKAILSPKRMGDSKTDSLYSSLFAVGISRLRESKSIPAIRRLDTIQAQEELRVIARQEKIFSDYLADLVEKRLDSTVDYGKSLSVEQLVEYLKGISGTLYEDTLLAMVQQYSISDSPVVFNGEHKLSTGFNLAFFGSPGTGKSFATVDFVIGNENDHVPAHGLPGVNRYCGGMTASQFIRIAQAYEGKRFNFIVPEFNEWFKYPGMVEILKQALERKHLRYETTKYSISPYKFDSFFAVNYNTHVTSSGYEVTVNDPNFNAIEDRMLCRLHAMTKQRFFQIIDNVESQLLSSTRFSAAQLRDHLTLVYAIQTGHEGVKDFMNPKDVQLSEKLVKTLTEVSKKTIESSRSLIEFSPRLIKRSIQFASALSMVEFFRRDKLEITDQMISMAKRFFLEEISVRGNFRIKVEDY